MKLKLTLTALLLAGSAQASEFQGWSYEFYGCNEECVLLEDGDFTQKLDSIYEAQASVGRKTGSGRGKGGLVSTLSNATGLAGDTVSGLIDGLRDTALANGYDSASASLRGSDGRSITYTYNLRTGAWSVNFTPKHDKLDKHKKLPGAEDLDNP